MADITELAKGEGGADDTASHQKPKALNLRPLIGLVEEGYLR